MTTASPHDWPYAETLKQLRKAKGLGMEEAANLIGARRATWDRWERLRKTPSADNLRKLVDAFEVPPEHLGYDAPQGWELVPSKWIRERFDKIDKNLEKLLERS